jgi:hypothetical protein
VHLPLTMTLVTASTPRTISWASFRMGAALKVKDHLRDRHSSIEQEFDVCRKRMRGPLADPRRVIASRYSSPTVPSPDVA